MGVVELAGELFVETVQAVATVQVDRDHILQRAGDKKVLLLQAQLFTLHGFIVRVQHLGDVFRHHFFLYGAHVVANVEILEVEGLGSLRRPQA